MRLWSNRNSQLLQMQIQNVVATLEDSLEMFINLNFSSNKNSAEIFIAALFIIAKTWNQPRCLSIGEQMNKLWYIQPIKYYLALKN